MLQREKFQPKKNPQARREEVRTHEAMLIEKLKRRLDLNPSDTRHYIQLNFFVVSSRLNQYGNRVNKMMVCLANPSGVTVDLTYLIGSVFGIRVVRGGLLSGEISTADIRRKLHTKYGKELGLNLEDFWLNHI